MGKPIKIFAVHLPLRPLYMWCSLCTYFSIFLHMFHIHTFNLFIFLTFFIFLCIFSRYFMLAYWAPRTRRNSIFCVHVFKYLEITYRIQPNYRTYSYKRRVKQFRSLQITASLLFVYFFIKAYVMGTHLNCIDLSMQFKWAPTTYAFTKKKKSEEKLHYHHQISLFLIFFLLCTLSRSIRILTQLSIPRNFGKPKRTVR